MRTRGKQRLVSLFMIWLTAAAVFLTTAAVCFAGIPGDEAFQGLEWNEVFRVPVLTENGTIQSICVTDNYIITMENTDDSAANPDIVTAWYRNNTDADGNPVEQYSQAVQNASQNWEHCNGMAWNPDTDLIYVAPYTHYKEENRGCIFVMDPDTLEYLYSIKITDDYDILGIAYDREQDRYIMQSNTDGEYRMLILNSDFQITEDLGPSDITPGTNSQDCCVMGDYVINSPLTYNMGIGEYVNVYSLSRNCLVTSLELGIPVENAETLEPESFEETENGVLMMDMSVHYTDGTRGAIMYEAVLPYNFTVTTAVEGGTITGSSDQVSRGSEYSVTYEPWDGYELTAMEINHESVDPELYRDGYTFSDVQDNCVIEVHFKEPGSVEATPEVTEEPETTTPTPEVTVLTEQDTASASGFLTMIRSVMGKLTLAKVLLIICTILFVIVGVLYYLQLRKSRTAKRQASRAARESARRTVRRKLREEFGDDYETDLDKVFEQYEKAEAELKAAAEQQEKDKAEETSVQDRSEKDEK